MFQGSEDAPGKDEEQDQSEYDSVKPDLGKLDGKWGDYESGSHNYGVNGHGGTNKAPSLIVELGAGSLKKTSVLLRSLAKYSGETDKPLTYYAVDLEHDQLVSTLDALLNQEKTSVTHQPDGHKVVIKGARTSYEEFLPQLSSGDSTFDHQKSRKILLWLGSSLGNFTREEAADFLKRYVEALQPSDRFLVGIDSTMDAAKIELAYGDPSKVTEAFILNGITHLARIFHDSGWTSNVDPSLFEYVHRFNTQDGCHEAYLKTKAVIEITPADGDAFTIPEGELLLIERSFKYSALDIIKLLDRSGLRLVKDWKHTKHDYGLYLVEKPSFSFPSTQVALEKGLNPFGLPSLDEWKRLWAAFDCVTLDMIPRKMLHQKPIDLRRAFFLPVRVVVDGRTDICLFYIGHIPTVRQRSLRSPALTRGAQFCQIHLSKALNEPYTEPSDYTLIFERGIDPNMDDPTQCHDHSIVPEKEADWPKLHEILGYRDRVRQRMADLYTSGRLDEINKSNRRLARVIAMVYEHEAFHLETLL
jgi:uncharacterized SAM-dependent methyltransferase